MNHLPHDLAEVFPDDAALIRDLKLDDTLFAELAASHQAITKRIHRIESLIEAATDETLADLKARRRVILGEISSYLLLRRKAVA